MKGKTVEVGSNSSAASAPFASDSFLDFFASGSPIFPYEI